MQYFKIIPGIVSQQSVHGIGTSSGPVMNYQTSPMGYLQGTQQSLGFQQSPAQGYPQRQACAAASPFYQQPGSCSLARLQQMAEGEGASTTPPHQGPTPPAPPGTPHYHHKYYSQSPGQLPPDPTAAASRNSRNITGILMKRVGIARPLSLYTRSLTCTG